MSGRHFCVFFNLSAHLYYRSVVLAGKNQSPNFVSADFQPVPLPEINHMIL